MPNSCELSTFECLCPIQGNLSVYLKKRMKVPSARCSSGSTISLRTDSSLYDDLEYSEEETQNGTFQPKIMTNSNFIKPYSTFNIHNDQMNDYDAVHIVRKGNFVDAALFVRKKPYIFELGLFDSLE